MRWSKAAPVLAMAVMLAAAVSLLRAAPQQGAGNFRVLVDAGHGGSERGATLAANLAEKDLALELARKLHAELAKQGMTVTLLRDGDKGFGSDERAAAINGSQADLYVALHAASLGRGVRLYSSLLEPAATAGAFLPWQTAQAAFVERSRNAAEKLALALDEAQVPYVLLRGNVVPLQRLAAPAVAVEFAFGDELRDAAYQQRVTAALAGGIVNLRAGQEGR